MIGTTLMTFTEKLSPAIADLPNEIISQIFLVGTTDWRNTAPLTLPFPVIASSICYHWRQLARSNPVLWSFLVAPLHKEDEDCLYWISDWIGLSANLPLSVVVDDKLRRPRRSSEATNRLASEAVTLITQSWNRLRSLDISLDSFSLVKNQIIQLRHAPNLRQLSLCFRGPPFATIFIPEVDRPLPPSVTKLRAQNLALQSPCNLTSLTMHKPRLGYEGTQILFSGCPNLANLIIHNLVPVNSPIPAKRTEIRAESLQSLAIHSHGIDERGAVYFLSFLKIPNLSYLEVDGNTRIASILRSSISSSNVVCRKNVESPIGTDAASMSHSKKRKLSGLSGLELRMAYEALRRLKSSFVSADEESDSEADPDAPALEGFEDQVDAMLTMMGSRLGGPQSLSFSGMTAEDLVKLKILFTGFLVLKGNADERVKTTTSLGKDCLWSSENLYRHLLLLEGLVPRTTETSARAWIDAFLFRASAMLGEDKHLIVNMEHVVPATTISSSSLSTLSRFIDYSAVATDRRTAEILLRNSGLLALKALRPYSFFVVEAKPFNLPEHVPQAVSEMYASGKLLETKFVRGALTNGRDWIFLYLQFADNYEGASFSQSSVITWTARVDPNGEREIIRPWPEMIAAILADWPALRQLYLNTHAMISGIMSPVKLLAIVHLDARSADSDGAEKDLRLNFLQLASIETHSDAAAIALI
ncbi:hypothetical protein CVT26_003068 [Gymnopilus dilepis]|uniref:Uncharacterized protein n=1 Tax=Gymnopilus dilepis TaxID=231916 RepID=A0A409Y4N6_9AGAR|nr:hypothetical protein CVT26_003068 [Gymnopilus dilepis]